MKRKLKSERGETLIELMASILIASLSVTLVFGAIMASTSMDRQAQVLDKNFYNTLSEAEKQETPITGGGDFAPTGVTIKDSTGRFATPGVNFYGGENAYSYSLNTGGGT